MGDINLLDRINRLANKLKIAVTTSDKASKNKFGIVKVGNNINVASGVISVPDATESTKGVVSLSDVGGFGVDVLYTGDNASETAYTFPTGKSLSDYKFLVLAIDYSGEDHDCATRIVPVTQILAHDELYTTILYNGTYFITVKVDATKVTKYSGHANYFVNKIYAF